MQSNFESEQLTALLARCALGEQRAFSELYDQTSSRLFAVLVRLMRRRDWAEEALQEAFVKIWMNASEYRPDKGQPMTWMTSIARYRGLDMLRKDKGELSLEQFQEESTHIPGEVCPETLKGLAPMAEYRDLLECLKQLEETQRNCLLMAYCEGFTHVELSQRMERPVGTVKTWIRRAGQAMKACLEA